MLRFLILLSLRATAVFLLLGVLIARAWGWSEYASPELYVVYYQIREQRNRYFIVNADGASEGMPLARGTDRISKVDCSPDGQVFAFLTDSGALYSVTADGVSEHGVADRDYITINAANDGTIALFDPAAGWLRVNSGGVRLTSADAPNHPMDRIDISPQGLVLWGRHSEDIQVVAPETGEVVADVRRGFSPAWMAPGEMFTFYDVLADPNNGLLVYSGQFVMDMQLGKAVRVGGWPTTRPLSPDGTQVAAALVRGTENRMAQVVVYDLFTDANRRQLTFDPTSAAQPICFLAFRPAGLVGAR